jgi:hypothetical protein
MSHHLKAPRTNGVNDLSTFFNISNLELLLQKDGRLLIRGLDDAIDEDVIRRR